MFDELGVRAARARQNDPTGNRPNTAGPNPEPDPIVLDVPTIQLQRYLEESWSAAGSVTDLVLEDGELGYLGDKSIVASLGLPGGITTIGELRSGISLTGLPASLGTFTDDGDPGGTPPDPRPCHHLIYALLIDSTRVYDIFARVIERFAQGESLEIPSPGSQRWLHATEQLWFRDPVPGSITAPVSRLRPNLSEVIDNAYLRLLGMQVPRPTATRFPTDLAANTAFPHLFERLLAEVWTAIENAQNSSGTNPTDDQGIATLCKSIADLLQLRRQNGNLAQVELTAVAMMSWFDLTLRSNTAIVKDLRADASTPAGRLARIGERVGLPASSQADAFFQLAEPVSAIVRTIEQRRCDTAEKARLLYVPTSPLAADMKKVMTYWSMATGRDVKASRATLVGQNGTGPARQALPTSVSAPAPSPVNGSTPPRQLESSYARFG
jgi:hypothetical protein